MPVPDWLTWAMTGTRPLTCLSANSSRLLRSSSERLTDSPACIGSASESAPLRRWNSMIFRYRSKSTRRSRVNGVTGVWTRPASNMEPLPAVRLGLEDAHLLELAADVGLALGRGGRQRLARGADRPAHHYHAALERRGILVAEEEPQPRQLVLAVARARPVGGHAGV